MTSSASLPAPPGAHHAQSQSQSLGEQWSLRKIVVERTETLAEGGSVLPVPVAQAWAAGVVRNPWIGTGTTSELVISPRSFASHVARQLTDRLLGVLGPVEHIEAFGKGALIGEQGELEHGAALTHTPYFAGQVRTALEGTAVISFADTRGRAGEVLVLPLCEKTTGVRRDHYQSVRVRLPDAPHADEIVLVAAASTGPRPFPRVGDRTTDLPLDPHLTNGTNP